MPNKARHAFGSLENIDNAIASGKVDAYDILFVKDNDGKPYVGWIDRDGNKVIVDDKAEFEAIKAQLLKIEKSFEKKEYEVIDMPTGTLVNYKEEEIRVMCPSDVEWVGEDVVNIGLRVYAPEGCVSYKNGLVENITVEEMKQFGEDNAEAGVDEEGRKYILVTLPVAQYDADGAVWNYLGASSNAGNYYGWYHSVEWYGEDGVLMGKDCVRINLANEECYTNIRPYYIANVESEMDTKVEEAISTAMEEQLGIIEF